MMNVGSLAVVSDNSNRGTSMNDNKSKNMSEQLADAKKEIEALKHPTLQPMETAPKDEPVLLDAGFGFLSVGHWNHTEECWVYALLSCNDMNGHDIFFENEYEANPKGWLPLPVAQQS